MDPPPGKSAPAAHPVALISPRAMASPQGWESSGPGGCTDVLQGTEAGAQEELDVGEWLVLDGGDETTDRGVPHG